MRYERERKKRRVVWTSLTKKGDVNVYKNDHLSVSLPTKMSGFHNSVLLLNIITSQFNIPFNTNLSPRISFVAIRKKATHLGMFTTRRFEIRLPDRKVCLREVTGSVAKTRTSLRPSFWQCDLGTVDDILGYTLIKLKRQGGSPKSKYLLRHSAQTN